MTIAIILASLVTDIMLGGMAYKMTKSQEKTVLSLGRIADSLDRRVTSLEASHAVLSNWRWPDATLNSPVPIPQFIGG